MKHNLFAFNVAQTIEPVVDEVAYDSTKQVALWNGSKDVQAATAFYCTQSPYSGRRCMSVPYECYEPPYEPPYYMWYQFQCDADNQT